MAPKSPWKTMPKSPLTQARPDRAGTAGKPSNNTATTSAIPIPAATTTTTAMATAMAAASSAGSNPGSLLSPSAAKYSQAQEDEVEALRSIYIEEFEDIEVKGAWSKTTDRAFRLRLKALSDTETSVALSVRLTATYPETVPLLTLEDVSNVRERTLKKVQEFVKTRPKELLGDVMIFELATSIQDLLEDDVAAREENEALPSLEEERTIHEAAATELAKQQEAETLRKKDEEKAEEERMLKQMVNEEIARRREIKKKNRPTQLQTGVSTESVNQLGPETIAFDRVITIQDEGTNIAFSSVAITAEVSNSAVTESFAVRPVLSQITAPLVLKRARFNMSSNESRLKKAILDLEEELEDLKRLRQSNITNVFDFKIQKMDSAAEAEGEGYWQINILIDYANRGSLTDMFEIVESIPTAKVRVWTIDLLEALDFYHRNGVVHRRIHANNVLFCKGSSGTISVKLADGGFQERLHELKDLSKKTPRFTSARSAYWISPELSEDLHARHTRKTDVWELGIVFLQMLFGLETPEKHSSPSALMESSQLSEPLEEMIRKFFKPDPKKRPSAFDLIPSEFLRNDVDVFSRPVSPIRSRPSATSLTAYQDRRIRRESSSLLGHFSRYASEWVELGRLGKGGYGEVVKARNKMDGRIYAIKRIKQKSASGLTEVLSEVMLLSRLNHPYVVRYYAAWTEDTYSGPSETEEESTTVNGDGSSTFDEEGQSIEFGQSTGGLDFISSSGYPKIQFGDDSDENAIESDSTESDSEISTDEEEDDDDDSDNSTSGRSLHRKRTSSSSRPKPTKTILYIQMEYCERHTLRDLIRKGLYDNPEEGWKLFRQVLEGLAHIHNHGIIHRDLKPDNIFIDETNNPRIGDFGLATSGQYQLADKGTSSSNVDGDMTRSIGTTLYVAPELRTGGGGNYNEKVDMYSLGIIFFEMCHPLNTAMERDHVIRELREKEHSLPVELQAPEKVLQGSIIESLINHRPGERPSSAELLRSGKLPLQIEDETIKEALKGLSDRGSPYYQKMMSALFSQPADKQVKDYVWDLGTANATHATKCADILLQTLVKERLSSIFRRHGAIETQRPLLFPRSGHYTNNNVVQLLDASGTLVQMPYDLTLPYARSIAREAPATEKTFTIGNVFRDTYSGGAPRSNGEADFDIVSHGTLDLALKEAEVIKVMDEIVADFPSLSSSQMCFHINHSDLLELILGFCRINIPQRPAVKEILSKLNIQQWTWQKIRNELRSPTVGVSSTSLDDLARFDWRDTPEKAFSKIRALFEGTEYLERSHSIFAHLRAVVGYTKQFNVHIKAYINPLSCFNEKFYSGGVLFQCLYDTKRRDVLAAGGRYDKLIEEHSPKVQGQFSGCHAVGMNLGWDRLVASMARYQKNASKQTFLKKSSEEEGPGQWATRRCDILVASFDATVLRSAGVKLVGDLWAHGLSAELAVDTRSPETLLARYREDNHSWIIIIKHDSSATGKPDLKVKSMLRKEDTDIRSSELYNYLRAEMRDREQRECASTLPSRGRLLRGSTAVEASPTTAVSKSQVQVLVAQHRSKKSNKWAIVETAQSRSRELLDSMSSSPIAAIETKDEVMNMIRETRLSDPDGWRRVIQSVKLEERQYLQEIHNMLSRYAANWKEEGGGGTQSSRTAFVYNFRTGGCFLYDLGL